MKRHRLDTVEGAKIVASKMKEISWPELVPYSEEANKIFIEIIKERPSSMWSEFDIIKAAGLALDTVTWIKIASVASALGAVDSEMRQNLQAAHNRVKAMSQSLGLNEAAKGNPADRAKRQKIAMDIEDNLTGASEFDKNNLLAN